MKMIAPCGRAPDEPRPFLGVMSQTSRLRHHCAALERLVEMGLSPQAGCPDCELVPNCLLLQSPQHRRAVLHQKIPMWLSPSCCVMFRQRRLPSDIWTAGWSARLAGSTESSFADFAVCCARMAGRRWPWQKQKQPAREKQSCMPVPRETARANRMRA